MKLNKDIIYFAIIISLIAGLAQLYFSFNFDGQFNPVTSNQVKIYYSKESPSNQLIIEQIQQAQQYVYFAIYTFTRPDIKDALIGAKYRGLEVKGIIDKEQTQKIKEQNTVVKDLQKAGIPIMHQTHDALMHLKVLVTDKSFVTGSFNWTTRATMANDEVLEIGHNEDIRLQYQKILHKLFAEYSIN